MRSAFRTPRATQLTPTRAAAYAHRHEQRLPAVKKPVSRNIRPRQADAYVGSTSAPMAHSPRAAAAYAPAAPVEQAISPRPTEVATGAQVLVLGLDGTTPGDHAMAATEGHTAGMAWFGAAAVAAAGSSS